jgi:DNA processing protein
MKDIFYLSWFLKDEVFHKEMLEFVKVGKLSDHLKSLLKLHQDQISKGKAICKKSGASVVVFSDPDYPNCFKSLERPPWVLTYKGNLKLLDNNRRLSVVGSRRADPEVLYWLNKNFKIIHKDSVLVSGGAIGVDQEVHKAALRENLATIIVLPVGIDQIYPPSLSSLVSQFFKKGHESVLLLSQFFPSQQVYKSSFYPRNYVLSAISPKLIVVQSEVRSGTMVTAKYALENDKEIYVLPASPWDLRYSGNLKLLEEGAYQLIDLSLIQT